MRLRIAEAEKVKAASGKLPPPLLMMCRRNRRSRSLRARSHSRTRRSRSWAVDAPDSVTDYLTGITSGARYGDRNELRSGVLRGD